MTFRLILTNAFAATSLLVSTGLAVAQDNPLLAPAETNPLLQQAQPTEDQIFQQRAAAIDAAATKTASDPVCQNIRTNYNNALSEIMEKSGSDEMSLSGINRFNSSTNSAAWRAARINSNLGGRYSSGALGDAASAVSRGTNVVNDAAAIGGLLGISGKKMSQKKARKKAAKLEEQALDAVTQTGCPMATFI